mmetsp:Transcript_7176/g.24454  ORF Transcript_7176/g.24454 Transcript_7176/m.24454 type:complete len:359 (-) Transcript_7176:295-1371(-)
MSPSLAWSDSDVDSAKDRLEVRPPARRAHRVVRRVPRALPHLQAAPGVLDPLLRRAPEGLRVHPRGARGEHHHAAVPRGARGEGREAPVGGQRRALALGALGKGRRVHHGHVEAPPARRERRHGLEGVPHEALVARGGHRGPPARVGLKVRLRVRDGPRRRVHGDHLPGAAVGRVQGETARVGEHVEHPGPVHPPAEVPGPAPVVALVEKKTRFLTGHRIAAEGQAMLQEGHGGLQRGAVQGRAVLEAQPVRRGQPGDLPGGEQRHTRRGASRDQRVGDVAGPGQPAGGVGLGHGHVPVAVHHEAWEAIVLAVDHAVARGLLAALAGIGKQRRALRGGRGDARGDPGRVHGRVSGAVG